MLWINNPSYYIPLSPHPSSATAWLLVAVAVLLLLQLPLVLGRHAQGKGYGTLVQLVDGNSEYLVLSINYDYVSFTGIGAFTGRGLHWHILRVEPSF